MGECRTFWDVVYFIFSMRRSYQSVEQHPSGGRLSAQDKVSGFLDHSVGRITCDTVCFYDICIAGQDVKLKIFMF